MGFLSISIWGRLLPVLTRMLLPNVTSSRESDDGAYICLLARQTISMSSLKTVYPSGLPGRGRSSVNKKNTAKADQLQNDAVVIYPGELVVAVLDVTWKQFGSV